ncbi:MAG: NusA-like transcription termination signal-binding factor [Candidatus Nitrosocaldus sp.]|nr:NusA-like transcription termination signal-binding factor [Candidatus Nitrosocaldus sp.]MCS7141891.1 NusA-like transcription termination signal-binding factor [Candidatus Nitrosocaldus sp.]MDW8000850.1 NusA-like transcription termination signal-binding factor [Candidatus Nitrosocaldus sp.]MDW8275744.1 NusA-like transcription termination signal-binding factor [Candidatus Nitrosocaldus sp.]
MTGIRLTSDELRLMSLFQSVTTVTARDCVIDEKMDRVIFVIGKGDMGLAIGRNGSTIRTLQGMIGKRIELVEYADDLAEFVRNIFGRDAVLDVKIGNHTSNGKVVTVIVDPRKKGMVVGREGRNVEKARLLTRRYFDVTNVIIRGHEVNI